MIRNRKQLFPNDTDFGKGKPRKVTLTLYPAHLQHLKRRQQESNLDRSLCAQLLLEADAALAILPDAIQQRLSPASPQAQSAPACLPATTQEQP